MVETKIKLRNYDRMILTSNNVMCAKITDNSRRYVIYDVSNELIGNAEYFRDFAIYMSEKSNQKTIIEYLRSIDIQNTNWISERPISETYNALKSLCADPILKFLTYLWEKHRSEQKILKVASDIHREYLEYLEKELKMKEEGIRIWNRTMFGRKMNGLCEREIGIEKKEKFGPSRVNGYTIDLNKLRPYLEKKGMLTESVYMFIDTEEDEY